MKLQNDELLVIQGGAITAAWITAIVRGVNAIMDVGRALGTVIRRAQTGNLC